jgi:hypothetical protein
MAKMFPLFCILYTSYKDRMMACHLLMVKYLVFTDEQFKRVLLYFL